MKSIAWRLPMVLGALTLSACGPVTEDAESAAVTEYECGALALTTELNGEELVVQFADRSYNFTATPAASGARYVNQDLGGEFWNKGNEAQFSSDLLTLPLCIEKGTLPQDLNARGNEPFWLITIDGDRATLRKPDNSEEVTVRTTDNVAQGFEHHLEFSNGATLDVAQEICYDSMSGQSYPYRVALTEGDSVFAGCAGDPQRTLSGASWHLQQTATEQPVSITFHPESRVSGYAGCNYFTGGYTVTGEGLSFAPMAVTKRMCAREVMSIEQEFLQQLTQVNGFRVFADATMQLRLPNGEFIAFTRQALELPSNGE